MKSIYAFIDDIPMYRAVLYALIGIVTTAFILAGFGQLSFSLFDMTASLGVILAVSYVINTLFAYVFSATTNKESSLITGLIVFLLIFPVGSLDGLFLAALTAAIAQASKYILAIRGKHIFNPAAIAVVISSFVGLNAAVWWVGSPLMIPAVIVLGGLTVLKVREISETLSYFTAAASMSVLSSIVNGHEISAALSTLFISGPLLFAGSIMLTEPLTAPGMKHQKIIFAVFVGALTGSSLAWFSKPEVALVLGNAVAFFYSQARLLRFKLVSVTTIAPGIIEVLLEPLHKLKFQSGQYLELSVPHSHADSRGVRRVFSIASGSAENVVRLGMNLPSSASSYKRALSELKPGTVMTATRIAGSFVLPRRPDVPLVFIAGGIGITPFRSMIESLLRAGDKRQVTLFYGVRDESLIVYSELLLRARDELGLRIIPVLAQPSATWRGETGFISAQIIAKYCTTKNDALYYISGSNNMVEAVKKDLLSDSIAHQRIRTDHFTGY